MAQESLKNRIKAAKSDVEVSDLLKEGKSYIFTSTKTRNAWSNTGRKVIASLKGQTYVAPKQAEPEFVEKKDKKQKKVKFDRI